MTDLIHEIMVTLITIFIISGSKYVWDVMYKLCTSYKITILIEKKESV